MQYYRSGWSGFNRGLSANARVGQAGAVDFARRIPIGRRRSDPAWHLAISSQFSLDAVTSLRHSRTTLFSSGRTKVVATNQENIAYDEVEVGSHRRCARPG
jgi:hypothetical protein